MRRIASYMWRMDRETDTSDLTGKLLIAMPGMGDPRFDGSVIFLCSHSTDGALGLVVNRPSTGVRFSDLLRQLKIEPRPEGRDIAVRIGGPVEHGRGFVLHSADYTGSAATLKVGEQVGLTATLDVLEAIAHGTGPDRAILALGYAGWGPMQLEAEIALNTWLVADASDAILFGDEDAQKWALALRSIGVEASALSATAGRA